MRKIEVDILRKKRHNINITLTQTLRSTKQFFW